MGRKLYTTSDIHCGPTEQELSYEKDKTVKEEMAKIAEDKKQLAHREWLAKREALPVLPPIGSVLESLYPIPAEDTVGWNDKTARKSWSVKCYIPDVFDKDPRWCIHAGPRTRGLFCILDMMPTTGFIKVKITAHAKSGKAVFGEVIYEKE